MFEEEPLGMGVAPFDLMIRVLLKQHAKLDASLPISMITQVMKTDDLSFPTVLGQCRRATSEGDQRYQGVKRYFYRDILASRPR